jgi:hydroxymethylpyrimidine/phosphomethylpyrimidine kinase
VIPNVLSIAGSDPSGGAGIQADLKTFAALGAYGMAAITALTVQNTRGVRNVRAVAAELVADQIDAVLDDVRVDAVKIGLLGDPAVIAAVGLTLAARPVPVVVLDPVLVATSGDVLLRPDALPALRALLSLADLITPNVPEAAVLLETGQATDVDGMVGQAVRLASLGPAVLLTGGHLEGVEAIDVLVVPGAEPLLLRGPRVVTSSTHGTGCTLSSALAALRPTHPDWASTAHAAKAYVGRALLAAADLDVGGGNGPLRHDV